MSRGHTEILDALAETAMVITGSGIISAVNRSGLSRLAESGSWIGRSLVDVTAHPPSAELAAWLRACSRSRQPLMGSLRLACDRQAFRVDGALIRPRSDTEEALLLLRFRSREESAGRFILLNEQIESLRREVARRQKTEEELREQREWLQVTLRSIGDAVITTDAEGRVTFLNPRAEDLTGWSIDEGIGRTIDDIFPIANEHTGEPVENPVRQVLTRGATVALANHTVLLRPDGTRRAIEDAAAPIRRSEGGRIDGVVLVFHDVEGQRQLELELRERADRLVEAARRTDDFLAMLGHELRNPLAPLKTGLELLGHAAADPGRVARLHRVMDRQVTQLTRLVDDLLEASRVSRGKITLRIERFDLGELAREVADDYHARSVDCGIVLVCEVPDSPVWIRADRSRVRQVLDNLLENAVKFSPREAAIHVRVTSEEDRAEVVVQDTGPGIPATLLPVVFDTFVQGDSSLARTEGGLGLGLALVKGIVELHGGTVRAQSGDGTPGTIMTVSLPRP